MREGIPEEVLTGVAGYKAVISAWRNGEVTAGEVPVMGGNLTVDSTKAVPELLTFVVPRWDGRDWYPADDTDHPLSAYGQQVELSIVITSAKTGVEYEVKIGRYLIQSAHLTSTMDVEVQAVGLLQVVADARLITPLAPRSNGTFASEFRRLAPAGITAQIDDALIDRRIPQSFEWAEDRLAAWYEIADAWPAQLRVDAWGQAVLSPPLPDIPAPVITVKDGDEGTLIADERTVTRDGVYNVVVARSSATDDPNKPPLQAVARQTTGPLAVGTFGEVVKYWTTPLNPNLGSLQKSAATILKNSLRPARVVPVTMLADPRIELDDPVEVRRAYQQTVWGYVTGYSLPLMHRDDATIMVGVAQ